MSQSTSTATRLIRTLLSTHPYLNTQQMWRIATEGFKPVLPPSQVIQEDGRIRMKRVSNIREGRRIWIPPPVARLPDHPFHSTTFLKSKVLSSLEAQGLIHKHRLFIPHRNEEERQAAIKQADKENRRAIRNAAAAKPRRDPPPPKEPTPFTIEYTWTLGPPTFAENGAQISWLVPPKQDSVSSDNSDSRSIEDINNDIPEALRPKVNIAPDEIQHQKSPYQPFASPGISKRWDEAEAIEVAYRQSKELEKEAIKKRQEIRRNIHKEQRELLKIEREADRLAGRTEDILREKERLDAIARIEQYAKQTGEDVSGWYEELGSEGSWSGSAGLSKKEDYEKAELGMGDDEDEERISHSQRGKIQERLGLREGQDRPKLGQHIIYKPGGKAHGQQWTMGKGDGGEGESNGENRERADNDQKGDAGDSKLGLGGSGNSARPEREDSDSRAGGGNSKFGIGGNGDSASREREDSGRRAGARISKFGLGGNGNSASREREDSDRRGGAGNSKFGLGGNGRDTGSTRSGNGFGQRGNDRGRGNSTPRRFGLA